MFSICDALESGSLLLSPLTAALSGGAFTLVNHSIRFYCSGQLIPDTVLSFSSVFAGANPSLN